MCKFCDDNSEHPIMFYDNHDSMNVYCGQYQGVSVSSLLSMKGNMLILHASGSYRSRSDCYYEDQGLDIDSKYSNDSKSDYTKLEYCPFCGKKLTSTLFEQQTLKDKIASVKYCLKRDKEALKAMSLHIAFEFKTDKDNYQVFRDMIWKDFEGDCKRTPIPLEVLMRPSLGKIKASIRYGEIDEYGYRYKDLDIDEGIEFHGSSYGTFYSIAYSLDENLYNVLADKQLIKRDEKRLNAHKNRVEKFKNNISKLEEKLAELNKELKKYK